MHGKLTDTTAEFIFIICIFSLLNTGYCGSWNSPPKPEFDIFYVVYALLDAKWTASQHLQCTHAITW